MYTIRGCIPGTSANELYVIGDGQVQVSRPDGLVVAVLGKGRFFGERRHLELTSNPVPDAKAGPNLD